MIRSIILQFSQSITKKKREKYVIDHYLIILGSRQFNIHMSTSQGKQMIHVTLMFEANFESNTSLYIYGHITFEMLNNPIIDIHITLEQCRYILDKGITNN